MTTACPQLTNNIAQYERERLSLRAWCDERGIGTANYEQWSEWRAWFDRKEKANGSENEAA